MVDIAEHVLDRFRLDGKIAVVTGGTGDMGSVYCRALADAGATVVATSRTASALDSLVAEITARGGRACRYVCDLRDRDAVTRFADEVLSDLGQVDVLVNNAYNLTAPIEPLELGPDAWQETFDIIVWGPLILCQRFGSAMVSRRRGSIINIGSQAASKPYLYSRVLWGGEAAMQTITMYLAEQWGPHNVRCNTLLPSLMVLPEKTALIERMAEMGVVERAVLGRLGDPREMAGPLVFLASDASSYVTGQVLVSGGDLFPPIVRP